MKRKSIGNYKKRHLCSSEVYRLIAESLASNVQLILEDLSVVFRTSLWLPKKYNPQLQYDTTLGISKAVHI